MKKYFLALVLSISCASILADQANETKPEVRNEVHHKYICNISESATEVFLEISYFPDEKGPGLFWLGHATREAVPYIDEAIKTGDIVDFRRIPAQMHHSAEAYFYTANGRWEFYEGGLYPPAAIYRTAIPHGIAVRFQIYPSHIVSNAGGERVPHQPFSAYYVGHGIYTDEIARKVDLRKSLYEKTKTRREAAGLRVPGDTDYEHMMHALVEQDMVENRKILKVTTIPESVLSVCGYAIYSGGN